MLDDISHPAAVRVMQGVEGKGRFAGDALVFSGSADERMRVVVKGGEKLVAVLVGLDTGATLESHPVRFRTAT